MRSTRRALSGALVAAAVIAAVASPADAAYHQSAGIYWDGYSGSDRQCAWWGNVFSDQQAPFPGNMFGESATATTRGSGCASSLTLPYGWIESRTEIQVQVFLTWTMYAESPTQKNPGGTNSSYAYVFGPANPPSYAYRNVSGHNALIAGGWKLYLKVSPTIVP